MRTNVAHFLSCIGALAFLAIALLGYIDGTFFFNFIDHGKEFHLHSAGLIPFADIAISIIIVSAIFTIFVLLSLLIVTFPIWFPIYVLLLILDIIT